MIINEKMNVNMSHHYTRKSTNVKVIMTAKRRIPVTRISSSKSRIMTSSRLHNNKNYTRDRNRIRSRSKRRSRSRSRIHVHNEVHNVLSQSSGIEYRSNHNSKSTNTNTNTTTTNNNNNENRDEFSSMMSNYNNNDSHKFNSADINDNVIADYDVTQVVLDDEEDNDNNDNEDDVDISNSYGNENEPRVNEKEIERLKERFTRRRHEGITMLRERAAMGALREKQPRTSGFGLGRQQTNSTSSSSSSSSGGDGEGSSSSSLSAADIDFTVDPRTLKPGEYIVHEKIGIGVFEGIYKAEATTSTSASKHNNNNSNNNTEYVVLRFHDSMAKLRMESAEGVLYRYFATEGEGQAMPKLNRLKDRAAWNRRSSKARQSVQGMVVSVMDTYVKRLSR